jgi:hypothetical protein
LLKRLRAASAFTLTCDVDLDALPPQTSHALRHVLPRCLERDPEQCLRDMGQARLLLGSDFFSVNLGNRTLHSLVWYEQRWRIEFGDCWEHLRGL